jgi:hypothetical protein
MNKEGLNSTPQIIVEQTVSALSTNVDFLCRHIFLYPFYILKGCMQCKRIKKIRE